MIDKLNQSVAYICPECSAITKKKLNIFAFSGCKTFELPCSSRSCKGLSGAISEYRDKYRISLLCDFCGEIHEFTITKAKFWDKDYFTYTCPNTNFDIFYAGNTRKINQEIKRQEEILSEMSEEFFPESPLLTAVFSLLQDMTDNHAVSCSCGSKEILPFPMQDGVILVCEKCEKFKKIPLNEEEYRKLLNSTVIKI